MIVQDMALENVLINWDNIELSVEKRLNKLRDYILESAGLHESIDHYKQEGKMLHRYVAGFINRYFMLLKDASFLLLDPLHILDVIWAFIKNAFKNPLQTVKNIWGVWTGLYRLGAFGLGMVTADALLAAIIAGIGVLFRGGQVIEAFAEAGSAMTTRATNMTTSLPRKLLNIGKGIGIGIENIDQVFTVIAHEPQTIIATFQEELRENTQFNSLRKYKKYTTKLRKRDTLT